MDTISQRFLSASIKLGRPPDQCVVFESSPAGITAAHNCTMKVHCLPSLKHGIMPPLQAARQCVALRPALTVSQVPTSALTSAAAALVIELSHKSQYALHRDA